MLLNSRLLAGAQVAIRQISDQHGHAARFQQTFEASLAYEGLTLYRRDQEAAVRAFLENRRPTFIGE
jgi:enoyl-CoA hydratase/carnithine racemase